ncbi:hypothetical protein F441_21452 [Phytophthora nicotianae CJ01A1]|uniref:peptidylprolyl isomerase n=3 Tax=Phytophthora nicotianae TaxID=4792 RepID=W2HVV0_PHYNI|nr:hypothetical protein L915_20967 [Phytophthora nicotianae]ETL25278.1 hypothetical protein L916_20849 [Phytophthora nicotianae]ETO60184.1 hypothetical protein F444_21583 [Phytophthora nicotianae P1976]ETP01277.1 hypothetical protein F441_21452 [Phytophthora nicotianae CJ01A1]
MQCDTIQFAPRLTMVTISESEREGFDDVLGSGGIFRKLLTTNTDGIQAEFGEEVGVKYSTWVLKSGQKVAVDEARKFRIGDGEVMPALELVAKMMHVGEVCEVRCDARFAYGDVGLEPHVAPGDEIKLVVELCRVGKKITAEMSSQELIVEATQKKESGNRYFKEKNYEQAAKLYKRALKLLETWEHSEEDAAQCKELLIALGNNVGNVQHKLKQYKEARQSSLEVLQLDGKNVKAMYRIGQIALDQNEFDEANMFLRKALEIEPKNAKVRQLLVQLKKKKRDQKALERKLYAKLGGNNAAETAETGKIAALLSKIRQNPAILAAVVTVIIAILMYVYVGKPNYEISDEPIIAASNDDDTD